MNRFPTFAAFLLGALFFSSAESVPVSAATLSKPTLRKYGFAGNYRGRISGNVSKWNGASYTNFPINQFRRQRMPFPSGVVAGPSVSNGFFLTFGRISGNERRATVKGFYSGVSFNSEYGLNMIGSGVKTVKIRKKGRSNPRYVMKVVDSFNENAQVGGALYTGWRLSGTFTKR